MIDQELVSRLFHTRYVPSPSQVDWEKETVTTYVRMSVKVKAIRLDF